MPKQGHVNLGIVLGVLVLIGSLLVAPGRAIAAPATAAVVCPDYYLIGTRGSGQAR